MLLKYIEETVRESLVRCRRRAFGRKYGQNDGICNWLSVSVLRNIDISRLCDQAFIARRLLSFRVAIAIVSRGDCYFMVRPEPWRHARNVPKRACNQVETAP